MSGETANPASELDEARLMQTRTKYRLSLGPLDHVSGDLGGLVGEQTMQILGMFYPRNMAKKANVVITELVTNVFENIHDPKSTFDLELDAGPEGLVIAVRNQVGAEQYEKVKERIETIHTTPDLRALLASTIRERRAQRLKGGLGLMRLAQENKFDLAIAYEAGTMTVTATYSTGVQS